MARRGWRARSSCWASLNPSVSKAARVLAKTQGQRPAASCAGPPRLAAPGLVHGGRGARSGSSASRIRTSA
eukprot:1632993-Pyramimonas_sp.AAC.1